VVGGRRGKEGKVPATSNDDEEEYNDNSQSYPSPPVIPARVAVASIIAFVTVEKKDTQSIISPLHRQPKRPRKGGQTMYSPF